jgi:3-hydroxyacyl-[acyl-carrier-protein] dehydratase
VYFHHGVTPVPPPLLIDLSLIDLNHVIYDRHEIEQVNPHRYEMRLLDGIVYANIEKAELVGFSDIQADAFWVRGHIPGRPMLPGVLMIEAAAQLASFGAKKMMPEEIRFLGFSGIEGVKFRQQVLPGCRLYLLGRFPEFRPRRFTFTAQGVVNGQMVFEATIIGMPI